jgi:menaquinone-dependent protoporphyrinogen oxidase
MHVLVAYGSKQGGTKGLAEWLGSALEKRGFEVDVRPAREVGELSDYDAVVVGGALYAFMWHKDAKRFVRRHRQALKELPVWVFSSGPLDDSATEKEIPPVRFVRRAMERLGARGHITFGGRLPPEYEGPLPVGDWRSEDQVDEWAASIAETLHQVALHRAKGVR